MTKKKESQKIPTIKEDEILNTVLNVILRKKVTMLNALTPPKAQKT